LRLRTDSYREGKTINYNASSAALTPLKQQPEVGWLNEVSCVPLQQELRHLQTAFKGFFEKRTLYPNFKKKHGRQSAEYTRSAFKFTRIRGNRTLNLSKIGKLDIRWSRGFKSNPTTVTIIKDCAGRYFVSLCLDEEPKPMQKTKQAIGVDFGLTRLATLSNGERFPNPRHTTKYAKRLARAQRNLSRKVKGSGRRERQRLRVARIHTKIQDSRKDVLNKLTTDLVRRFDVIAIEDLNVRGMVRNEHLSKALSDGSFGRFRSMLESKGLRYGKEIRLVDRFFPSSKRCFDCGHINGSLALGNREWACPECGTIHDRDENAARNILAAGHVATARRGNRRPSKVSALAGISRRSVNSLKVKHI
jgi:putative transposase